MVSNIGNSHQVTDRYVYSYTVFFPCWRGESCWPVLIYLELYPYLIFSAMIPH